MVVIEIPKFFIMVINLESKCNYQV
jgi:hypothetical protein